MASKPLPEPDVVNLEPCEVAYIRHKGYGRSIAKPWQQLKNWALSEQRSMDIQISLHHSNPALMPLAQCHYVACVGIDKQVMRRGKINSVVIPGGLHAAFKNPLTRRGNGLFSVVFLFGTISDIDITDGDFHTTGHGQHNHYYRNDYPRIKHIDASWLRVETLVNYPAKEQGQQLPTKIITTTQG